MGISPKAIEEIVASRKRVVIRMDGGKRYEGILKNPATGLFEMEGGPEVFLNFDKIVAIEKTEEHFQQ